MRAKSLMSLTSALTYAAIVLQPLAAQADDMRQVETWGRPAGMGTHVSNVACAGLAGFNSIGAVNVPRTPGVTVMPSSLPGLNGAGLPSSLNVVNQSSTAVGGTSLNVNASAAGAAAGGTTNNYYISGNVDNSGPINVTNNAPVEVNFYKTVNIDDSKNITINKPVTITKTIDASKNIEINKSINIDKSINLGGINVVRYGDSGYGGSAANITVISDAAAFAGANANAGAGGLDVSAEAASTCHFADATVVKAIHAVCVSADGHQFPASHMTGDTWINSGYEGEVARCLPGSTLKVMVGSVMMSSEGMAVSMDDAQVLACAPGEAVRHFKGGMLKCARAVKVPDCTERTNLRKWGTGDMFFTYATRVCLDDRREMVGGASKVSDTYTYSMTREQRQLAADAAAAKARTLHLPGSENAPN